MANGVGNRDKCAGDLEVVLQAGTNVAGGVEDKGVMCLGGGNSVVSEVVDDLAVALSGNGNVELVEHGDKSNRDLVGSRHGQEDVAAGIDEVDDGIGSQIGSQTCASQYSCILKEQDMTNP